MTEPPAGTTARWILLEQTVALPETLRVPPILTRSMSRVRSTERYDDRELYVVIEHPEWQIVVAMNPEAAHGAREIAAALNQAARRVGLREQLAPPSATP